MPADAQTGGMRVACERADMHAAGGQLRDNLAADSAGSSDDQDALHRHSY
jgi:hypothetical protein